MTIAKEADEETLSKRLVKLGKAIEGFPTDTPFRDRLSEQIKALEFTGRGWEYQPKGLYFHVESGMNEAPPTTLHAVKVVVHGEMTWNTRRGGRAVEMTDAGATVTTCYWHASQLRQPYLESKVWDGHHGEYIDLPPNIRLAIGKQVGDAVLERIDGDTYWRLVAQEAYLSMTTSAIISATLEIRRNVERVEQWVAGIPAVVFP